MKSYIIILFLLYSSLKTYQNDITEHLQLMNKSWSIGNGCGSNYTFWSVSTDVDLNGNVLELNYCKITIQGRLLNLGMEVSVYEMQQSGLLILSDTTCNNEQESEIIILNN